MLASHENQTAVSLCFSLNLNIHQQSWTLPDTIAKWTDTTWNLSQKGEDYKNNIERRIHEEGKNNYYAFYGFNNFSWIKDFY